MLSGEYLYARFSTIFQLFCIIFELAKLATTSIRVKSGVHQVLQICFDLVVYMLSLYVYYAFIVPGSGFCVPLTLREKVASDL